MRYTIKKRSLISNESSDGGKWITAITGTLSKYSADEYVIFLKKKNPQLEYKVVEYKESNDGE